MESISDYVQEKVGSYGFQRYFKNTSWVFLGKIFSLIVGFIVSIYVARYLGPNLYGLMSFVVSFTTLCGILGDFGIDSLLNKGLNEKPELEAYWLGTGFFLKILGALISISLPILIGSLFKLTAPLLPLIFVFALSTFFQSWDVIDFYFQSKVVSRYSNITLIIVSFLCAVLEIGFVIMRKDVIFFLLLYPVQYLLLAIGFMLFYRSLGKRMLSWRVDPALFTYLLLNSWPFILSGISSIIYSQIDQVLLRVFIGGQTVGIYAVASNLSEPWSFVPSLLCSSLFPAIINARMTNLGMFNKRMSALYALVFYIGLAIAVPITIFAPFIIRILYGAAYSGSALLLSICIWSVIGMSLSIVFQQYLVAENKLMFIFALNFVGMLCNVSLNLLLIPRIGATGAAISNSVSYLLPFIVILAVPSMRDQAKVVVKGLLFRFI